MLEGSGSSIKSMLNGSVEDDRAAEVLVEVEVDGISQIRIVPELGSGRAL